MGRQEKPRRGGAGPQQQRGRSWNREARRLPREGQEEAGESEGRGRTACEGTKVRERVTSLGTHTGPVMPVHEGFEGVEK